jgi:hypothetical protein
MAKIYFDEVKNQNISLRKFTPNSLVLTYRTETLKKSGDVTITHKLLIIEDVCRGTSQIEIVKGLLYGILAECRQVNSFNGLFDDCNLKARKVVSSFLSKTNAIFKADADGYLTKAVESETALSKTALNLKKDCILFGLTGKPLHCALHKFACAALVQFSWWTTLSRSLSEMLDGTKSRIQADEMQAVEVVEAVPMVAMLAPSVSEVVAVPEVVEVEAVEVVAETPKRQRNAIRKGVRVSRRSRSNK